MLGSDAIINATDKAAENLPSSEEVEGFFQKIINWFKDLFNGNDSQNTDENNQNNNSNIEENTQSSEENNVNNNENVQDTNDNSTNNSSLDIQTESEQHFNSEDVQQ